MASIEETKQKRKRSCISDIQPISSSEEMQKIKRGNIDGKRKNENVTRHVNNFGLIFDEEWTDAHETLTHFKLSEKKIANVLLEIVQRAFTYNRDIANKELQQAKKCAEQIVAKNEMSNEIQIGEDIAEEIREYRYLHAQRALQRITKQFLETNFLTIFKKHEININGNNLSSKHLEVYATKCVEVTWYLCAEDPPIVVVLDDSQIFDENLFESLTKQRQKIDYILWPALKQSKDDIVVTKGMVECITSN